MQTIRGNVYRVEHKHLKALGAAPHIFCEGPYQCIWNDPLARFVTYSDTQPDPHDESFEIRTYHYCAFDTITALLEWFTVPMLRVLGEAQYVVRQFECNYIVSQSGKQAFIDSNYPVTLHREWKPLQFAKVGKEIQRMVAIAV